MRFTELRVSQSATVKNIRILCVLEELSVTNLRFYLQLFRTPFHVFKIYFWNKKTSFVALFNAGFQIVLLGQLTLTNSCLLMHSILVRINDRNRTSGNKHQFG